MKIKPIPEYDGYLCTSGCGKDYDCWHAQEFDEANGIVRSGLDFDIKHDNESRHYEVVWADGKPMTKVSDNVFLK